MKLISDNTGYLDYMSKNREYQGDPKVGIFWYKPEQNRLIGVSSVFADELQFDSTGKKTTKMLHQQYWSKLFHRREPGVAGDYKQIPRGRVWEGLDGFFVTTGGWINSHPSARQLIIDEFDLPADTKFIIDSHWDIGQGWEG